MFAAESGGRDGIGELVEILRREPMGRHARWLAIALRWGGRLEHLASILMSLLPLEPAVIEEAAATAEALGDPAAARDARALIPG